MKFIKSNDNSLIKKFKSLSVKKYREQFGLFVVEGEKVVRECLLLGIVENIVINESALENYIDLTTKYDQKVVVVSEKIYFSIAESKDPQNILAIVKKQKEKEIEKNKNVLILDHLQDPGNMGTIIRSAVASEFDDLILIDCVDPYLSKTVRSSSGTIFFANFHFFDYEQTKTFLESTKTQLVLAEMKGKSVFDKDLEIPTPYALAIGNEGNGVSENLKRIKHISLSIPMNNRVESLNAGVSASVLMFILANNK